MERTTGEGISDKHSSQWKCHQQLSFLTDVFTPRNMKSNITPPYVDTIVVDVTEVMCNILTENYNVEEMSTEPMPESEDTTRAADHSFPANQSCNSETGRKRKSGKCQALAQLLALEERKIEQLRKAVQQKSIMSTEEDEGCHFLVSLLPHFRDMTKRRKCEIWLSD